MVELPAGTLSSSATSRTVRKALVTGIPSTISTSLDKKILLVEYEHAGGWRASPEIRGDGHMDAGRHPIAQFVKRERRLVAKGALGFVFAIARP